MGGGRKASRSAAGPLGVGPTFGEEVHRLRRQRGLRLDDLAEETGLSRTLIHDVEKDRYAPTPATIAALVDSLAQPGRADELAALAAETHRRFIMDLDGVARERIDVLVRLGRRLAGLEPGRLEVIRSALAGAG